MFTVKLQAGGEGLPFFLWRFLRWLRIPEYSATYSSDIRPPIPGYPATFDTLL